jgi:hypothetical protein
VGMPQSAVSVVGRVWQGAFRTFPPSTGQNWLLPPNRSDPSPVAGADNAKPRSPVERWKPGLRCEATKSIVLDGPAGTWDSRSPIRALRWSLDLFPMPPMGGQTAAWQSGGRGDISGPLPPVLLYLNASINLQTPVDGLTSGGSPSAFAFSTASPTLDWNSLNFKSDLSQFGRHLRSLLRAFLQSSR